MYDLTAPMETWGVTPDITQVDLYYKGTVLSDKTLVTDCVLLNLTADRALRLQSMGRPEQRAVPGGCCGQRYMSPVYTQR